MGHRRHRPSTKSHTLPSSPTHSSSTSSSDFEFTISLSPRKSSATDLCPADDLFYKGQLLPLHLSPRLSMVRTLLLSSSSTSSSSDTTTTASRDSTASTDSSSADLLLHHHLDCDSARPSSATDDDLKRNMQQPLSYLPMRKPSKYFSLPKLFRKDQKASTPPTSGGAAAVRRVSSSAREVIRKYFKKVKPFYEKLSQKQQQKTSSSPPPPPATNKRLISRSPNTSSLHREMNYQREEEIQTSSFTHSFSGNLRMYNRGRNCFSSCPSSMGSSPSHGRSGYGYGQMGRPGPGFHSSDSSSMEELQNAIQGAIMHCKKSMLQNKNLVSNEI